MPVIIGHGPFEKFGRQLNLDGMKPFSEVLAELGIPETLTGVTVAVIDSKIIDDNYQVKNEDEIHLFLLADGG